MPKVRTAITAKRMPRPMSSRRAVAPLSPSLMRKSRISRRALCGSLAGLSIGRQAGIGLALRAILPPHQGPESHALVGRPDLLPADARRLRAGRRPGLQGLDRRLRRDWLLLG